MRVELMPGVRLLQLFDHSFRRDGNAVIVPMGTFTAADNKTVLAKVVVPRGADGRRAVAHVSFAFKDLVAGNRGRCLGQLDAHLSNDPSEVSELDPLVGGRVHRAETAATLREANSLFVSGKVAAARTRLDAKTNEVRSRRRHFAPRVSKARQAELEADFARQLAVLDDASEGLEPPRRSASPCPDRRGTAMLRAAPAIALASVSFLGSSLDSSSRGFATAPPDDPRAAGEGVAGPAVVAQPQRSHRGRAAVRRNASSAADLAF